jgi:hypothetical protein
MAADKRDYLLWQPYALMVVQWKELGLTDPNAIECSSFFPACAFFFYIVELAKAAFYALTDEELEDIPITEESLGVLGMDYDLNLHCAVGLMRRIDGALPMHVATGKKV